MKVTYCIKVGDRFWVSGTRTSQEFPDAKVIKGRRELRKMISQLAHKFPNTPITGWKDYQNQDDQVMYEYLMAPTT